MGKLNIVIIHGIGRPVTGYSLPFQKGIARAYTALKRKAGAAGSNFAGDLNFTEIVWDDILAEHQRALAERLKSGFQELGPKNIWESITGKIFLPVKKGINWLRTSFAAEFVNDVIGYRNATAYQRIQERISVSLNQLPAGPVTVIAHSLGSVIMSDYIYDRQKTSGRFHSGLKLHHFITMGSPLALFALRYGSDLFASPISMETKDGQWINIFDRDDPISYPLKPLNAAYDQAVTRDVEVNTGIFGAAHVKYWTNRSTCTTIAGQLIRAQHAG